MVIWITGLSGAGKTTLSRALADLVKTRLPELVLVDGDVIRALFGGALGYSEPDRVIQIRRLQAVAKFLDDQGQVVVVAALYAHPDLLAWNRQNFTDYFEVYLSAPLELVQARDAKGLYAGARSGNGANVVGVDIPWHAPAKADLTLDAGSGRTPQDLAALVVQAIPRLRATLSANRQ
jgi:adenylylsulfate kinase-like enzyme